MDGPLQMSHLNFYILDCKAKVRGEILKKLSATKDWIWNNIPSY